MLGLLSRDSPKALQTKLTANTNHGRYVSIVFNGDKKVLVGGWSAAKLTTYGTTCPNGCRKNSKTIGYLLSHFSPHPSVEHVLWAE